MPRHHRPTDRPTGPAACPFCDSPIDNALDTGKHYCIECRTHYVVDSEHNVVEVPNRLGAYKPGPNHNFPGISDLIPYKPVEASFHHTKCFRCDVEVSILTSVWGKLFLEWSCTIQEVVGDTIIKWFPVFKNVRVCSECSGYYTDYMNKVFLPKEQERIGRKIANRDVTLPYKELTPLTYWHILDDPATKVPVKREPLNQVKAYNEGSSYIKYGVTIKRKRAKKESILPPENNVRTKGGQEKLEAFNLAPELNTQVFDEISDPVFSQPTTVVNRKLTFKKEV